MGVLIAGWRELVDGAIADAEQAAANAQGVADNYANELAMTYEEPRDDRCADEAGRGDEHVD